MAHRAFRPRFGLALALALSASTSLAATVDVDGDLSDWPDPVFTFEDSGQDPPQYWLDIEQVWVTDDNESGDEGFLYVAIELEGNFRPNVGHHDTDFFVYLDIDQDGQIGGPNDRIIELTEGVVTDGDGNVVGYVEEFATAGHFIEASIPYEALGLTYGSDDFGIAFASSGQNGIGDMSPNLGEGDGGFIEYPGTDPVPLAVTLGELGATADRRGATVQWSTATERDNLGFNVYRVGPGGQLVLLTPVPVPGLGDAGFGRDYAWHDQQGRPGSRYLLEDLEASGKRTLHGPVAAQSAPARTGMLQKIRRRPHPLRTAFRLRARVTPKPVHGDVHKFAVHASGLQRLTTEALAAVGFEPQKVQHRGVRLERASGPVPVLVDGDATWFVGLPELDRYADYEVVQARLGRAALMDERTVSGSCEQPVTEVWQEARFEEQRAYYINSPVEDPFYWAQIYAGHPATLDFEVPNPGGGASQLVLHATGLADVHAVSLELNGEPLGAVSWSGRGLEPLRVSVPEGTISETNTLVVELVPGAEFDLVSLDRIELGYFGRLDLHAGQLDFEAEPGTCIQASGAGDGTTLVLDVTEPERPELLGGYQADGDVVRWVDGSPVGGGLRRYLVWSELHEAGKPQWLGVREATSLRSRRNRADSLLITHPDFLSAAARLAEHHRAQGLRAMVVTTEQVYDELSFGRPGVVPIRELMDTARTRWRSAPAYVTLVGGSTVDSHGYLAGSRQDRVPTPFYTALTSGYEAASDAWFVSDAQGEPTAAIGRLPVDDAAEAEAVVDKLVTAGDALAAPTGRLLLAADSYGGYGASTTEFEQTAQRLAEACSSEGVQTDLWLKSDAADPRADLRGAAASGVDALAYLGHGFISGWSSSPMLLDSAGAGSWDNVRPFALLSFTCFDGAFTGPWGESLAWSLVRNPVGGAVVATAATSMADPRALRRLATELVCRLARESAPTVGDALRDAKTALVGVGSAETDLLLTYGLLGDPTTPNPWAAR